jgi:hypothetical protein
MPEGRNGAKMNEMQVATGLRGCTAIRGRWDTGSSDTARYLGWGTQEQSPGIGLAATSHRLVRGRIEAKVRLLGDKLASEARLVFRLDPATHEHCAVGLGGWGHAYSLQLVKGDSIIALAHRGTSTALEGFEDCEISAEILGDQVSLLVNGAEVLSASIGHFLTGKQVGLSSWGPQPVEFSDLRVTNYRPVAFVMMRFAEEWAAVYTDAIIPAAEESRVEVRRADDIKLPGRITDDILSEIRNADIVIAELSPDENGSHNANVFYELGYAHALGRPSVLLTTSLEGLPFDIKDHRCIRYGQSPDGRQRLRLQLAEFLRALSLA